MDYRDDYRRGYQDAIEGSPSFAAEDYYKCDPGRSEYERGYRDGTFAAHPIPREGR